MKFIHTADLHLDSPLRGLSAYPDAPAQRLRTATRDAFAQLVQQALDEVVDFMVIAGDIYDGNWKDFNTGLFFVRQMGLLRQAGIPVFLLYGNHDAQSEMTRSLMLPDNVRVFSSRKAETFQLPALQVALHGRSFQHAATTDNLVPSYPPPVPGWLNIGVLHTALEGHSEHARYAPCAQAELEAKGYQYWALGHVHESAVWQRGAVTLAYPGNLQGRHIREPGARGALLVTAEADEIRRVEPLSVDVLRWQLLRIDTASCRDEPDVLRQVGRGLQQLLDDTPGQRPLAVRVVFQGPSAQSGRWAGQEGQLRQEVIAQALALSADRIWIEKVRWDSPPQAAAPRAVSDEDSSALAELAHMAQSAPDDPDFMRSLQADWQDVLTRLPHEVLQASPELLAWNQAPEAAMMEGLQQATPLLLARLAQDSAPSSTRPAA
ncbi:MAG: hypothetical protein RLZZ352_257 [Pseudomonadota bacterium]